jgi:hypothetical protein
MINQQDYQAQLNTVFELPLESVPKGSDSIERLGYSPKYGN